MDPSIYCILVIVAFVGLLLHAVHTEEKRVADRRQQDLPHPVERRKGERRRSASRFSRLGWAMKAWGSKAVSKFK